MTRVSVAIMAHPSRKHFVEQLQERFPEAEVVWDRIGSRWDTGRRSLLAHDESATHHFVIQDDSIPCKDLVPGICEMLKYVHEHPISLYTGKVRPFQRTITPTVARARREGLPWMATEGPLWGPGLVFPAAHISEIVRWCDKQDVPNYDRRIGLWYKAAKIDCYYSVPSLVDHRGVDENPSLVPDRTGNRRAHWFIGADRSALEVDWSGGVARIEPVKVTLEGTGTYYVRGIKLIPGENYVADQVAVEMLRRNAPKWVKVEECDIEFDALEYLDRAERELSRFGIGVRSAPGGVGSNSMAKTLAYAIIDGKGSYSAHGVRLRPGANRITDPALLEHLRTKGPSWIRIQDDRTPPKPEPKPEPEKQDIKEPYEKFQARDGQWYFYRVPAEGGAVEQSEAYPDEESVDEAIEEAKQPKIPTPGELPKNAPSGMLKPEDLRATEYPCPECDKVLKSASGRTNHIRVMHPELVKA